MMDEEMTWLSCYFLSWSQYEVAVTALKSAENFPSPASHIWAAGLILCVVFIAVSWVTLRASSTKTRATYHQGFSSSASG